MLLLWEWLDIFLGKLRGVQQFYELDTDYFALYITDYIYIDDKFTAFKGDKGAVIGPRER